MLQIALRSKKSLNWNRSGTHRLDFLFPQWQKRFYTRGRRVVCTLPLYRRSPTTHRGIRRYFCETSLLLLNDKVSSNSTSKNGIVSKSQVNESTTLPPETKEFSYRQHNEDLALDKFTHFALNSRAIPLGSMQEENWLDSLDAIDAWLNIGGGFAVDSAERLVERLVNEQAATFSREKAKSYSSYSNRSIILADFQKDVLNAWIQVFHKSEANSRLAIWRAEQALFRLLELIPMADKSMMQSQFPIKEYISIVQGYLQLHTHYKHFGEKAAHLLLQLSSDKNGKWDINTKEYAALIGPIFERCATQLLTIDPTNPLVAQLLKTMTVLKEAGVYPEMNVPEASEQTILNRSSQRVGNAEKMTTTAMSPFEKETADNRLLDVLKSATKDDKIKIDGLLQKLKRPDPENDVIVALIEYFVGIGDSENASHWLQKLEASILVSSYHLVERVLESWMEQKGLRTPWRADEVFKAVTKKIREYDVNFVLSAKSFELIIGIWNTNEEQSAQKKIIDWYSQMNSLMVKPNASMLKMTLRALATVNIDNPLHLVSNDILQNWEDFTNEDKADIAIAVLEVISLQNVSIEMGMTLIDQFRADGIVPNKSLLQSSLSAVRNDASPSDVIRILNSLDITSGRLDLSCYILAIDTLFKLNVDTQKEIQSICDRAMTHTMKCLDTCDPNEISDFLYSVTAMHVHRKLYSETEIFLKRAQDLFLFQGDTHRDHSLIPLKCYKKLIVRNWYTKKTAQKVEESFENLMMLYRSGYSNLKPDCDLYTAYIDARAVGNKDVELTLDEMIENYKESDDKELKPQSKVFNTVLLSLNKRKRSKLYDKSIKILHLMLDLGVQPDIKTFNLVLKNTRKGDYKDVYERSFMLMKMIEESNLTPDSHTLHLLIDACGSALSHDREVALKRCLSTFGEIRKQNLVGPITYGVLCKVMYRLMSRDNRADKIGESLLSMCCDDGMLTSEVRGRLNSMMSRSVWEKQYVSRLSNHGIEPADWSRNVQIK